MLKTFKNLLFQNLGCLGAESLLKSLGTWRGEAGGGGGSTKDAKNNGRTLTFDLFKARSS